MDDAPTRSPVRAWLRLPRPAVRWDALGVMLPTLLAFGIALAGLRVEQRDLHVPFQYAGDALLILPMVRTTVETGTHWHTARLGAPGVQELHDFPVVDHLHFALLWLLGRLNPDPVWCFNVYHLLTYPLTALVAVPVLRRLGFGAWAAAAGGVLYAVAPYHLGRGTGHYFLSAYWTLPPAVLAAVRLCEGRALFLRRAARVSGPVKPPPGEKLCVGDRFRFHRPADAGRSPWLVSTLLAAVTASAGAYYAYFACMLFAVAGLYGWVAHGRRALGSALAMIALVVAFGILNHAPAIAYQLRNGHNAAATYRPSEDAEEYGLKLAQMLLPIPGHRVPELAAVRGRYASADRPATNENETSALGTIAAAGLIGLLAVAVLPVRKAPLIAALATLAAGLLLVCTLGGGGAIFNHVVSPQVRCYNRASILLAFLALTAALWVVERIVSARWRPLAFVALTAFGVWDQTPDWWFSKGVVYQERPLVERFHADRDYFRQMEAALGDGMVFQLPHVAFPETFRHERMSGTDHARGFVHTDRLRWSHGAMKGREADTWQRRTAGLPLPALLDRLALAGFAAVYVDRDGYQPAAGDAIIGELTMKLGPPTVHPAGDLLWFDLRPYSRRLREAIGEPAFAGREQAQREELTLLWLGGFRSFEAVGREDTHRQCGAAGELIVMNPTDRPRRVRVSMLPRSAGDFPTDLRIDSTTVTRDGGPWVERLPLTKDSPLISRELVLPPGRSVVRFRCRTPAGPVVAPPWNFRFLVAAFTLTEHE